MPGKLAKELHRGRPIENLQMEVFLNLVRTADFLVRDFDELFKPFNLSITQVNVLRILRYAGHRALPCKAIAQRMITRDPDITRLLDRLEARHLITRERNAEDRRMVSTQITAEGLEILAKLDEPMLECHARQLAHLSEGTLTQLVDLLEQVREPGGPA